MARTKNWSGARKQNPNNNPSSKIANTSSNAVRVGAMFPCVIGSRSIVKHFSMEEVLWIGFSIDLE